MIHIVSFNSELTIEIFIGNTYIVKLNGILDNTRTLDIWEYCAIPEQQWNAKNPSQLEYWTTLNNNRILPTGILNIPAALITLEILEYWNTGTLATGILGNTGQHYFGTVLEVDSGYWLCDDKMSL
ncbi:hypothetical protein Glove_365g85 [Diversispora epigaea]|uniref:Uncharacterized protein n=1 Tax=Diversispora epigaea TaxID=1348612 RepID=A0A397HBX8_9GLOM|nr:hypothetical protein Glove_365g85 [Diversispora epigaea]